jgi:hypothetical protein
MDQPSASRCPLLYTSRTVPGVSLSPMPELISHDSSRTVNQFCISVE